MLRADGTARAPVYLAVERDTLKKEEYALHTVFGSRLLSDADPAFDLINQGGASLLSLVRLEYENQIYTLISTDANAATGHLVTLTNPWSDFVNQDIKGDVSAGHLRLGTSVLALPPGAVVRMAIPWAAWNTAQKNPDVLESVKYTHKDGQPVTGTQVAEYLELDAVIVSLKSRSIRAATSPSAGISAGGDAGGTERAIPSGTTGAICPFPMGCVAMGLNNPPETAG